MTLPSLDSLLSGDVTLATASLAAVLVGVAIRVYYGSAVFHPRWTALWNAVRRVLVPLIQHTVNRVTPIKISVENRAFRREFAGTVDQSPRDLALAVNTVRECEVPLLSGLKTDWHDRPETGTFVWYRGPRPGGLPRWLRKYQIHVTCFESPSGATVVTAHYEANSYRPDMWADHLLKGDTFSADRGVRLAREAIRDAGVSLSAGESVTETDDTEAIV